MNKKTAVLKQKIHHCLIIIHGVDKRWDSRRRLKEIAERIISFSGTSAVFSHWHKYGPYGTTGIYVLKHSSLSIHTWPESKKIVIDILTCSGRKNWQALGKELSASFSAKKISVKNKTI